eukprot:7501534-Pyramimonas_sp.AAC.1
MASTCQRLAGASSYTDAVRYNSILDSATDSTVGFWIVNMCTLKRHLVASVRTSKLCRCGCK